MNFKKFYFVFSIFISIFLFLGGLFIIFYVNTNAYDAKAAGTDIFGGIMDDFKISKTPFNILVLGGDKVAKNTDTMMLVNYNPVGSKVSIMSIPRDTKVSIDGKSRKINYAYPHAGAKLAVQTVENLLDVNIKYYVFVDTKAFRQIIDILGGVDVTVPVDMNYDDPTQNLHIHLQKGRQHLDGKKAEQFMRFRKANSGHMKDVKGYYDGSDIQRIKAQQSLIKELIGQKANLLYLPRLNNVIDTVYDNLETNLTLTEVTRLIKGISGFSMDNVNMFTLPGTTQDGDPWYYLCDDKKASELVKQYFTGSGTFVEQEGSTPSEKPSKDTDSSSEKPASKPQSSTKKPATTDVTKDNPSNTDTSVEGTSAPMP